MPTLNIYLNNEEFVSFVGHNNKEKIKEKTKNYLLQLLKEGDTDETNN